jgi:hypothetical protein
MFLTKAGKAKKTGNDSCATASHRDAAPMGDEKNVHGLSRPPFTK